MKKILLAILFPSFLFAQKKVDAVILTGWIGNGHSTEDAFRPLAAEFPTVAFVDITGVSRGNGDRSDIYVVSITADSIIVDQIDADTTFFVISQDRNGKSRNGKGGGVGLPVAEQNRLRRYMVSRGFNPAQFNFSFARGIIASQIVRAVQARKSGQKAK